MFTILPIKGYIDQIDGFYCDGIHAGLKSNEKLDMGFIYTKEACSVAAIFTDNKFQAAPLKHFLKYEEDFKTNFVLINSRNANAARRQSNRLVLTRKEERLAICTQHFNLSCTGCLDLRI